MPSLHLEESDASMRQRLLTSLSQSFPGSALSKALHCSADFDSECSESDDDMKADQLSSSCFAELRLDKYEMAEDDDDDLTSLTWLQDTDLLKNTCIDADENSEHDAQKENGNLHNQYSGIYTSQTHPPHIPYNPQKHVNSKPPYSFSCLIFMAIEDSSGKKLPVKDIYHWILTHFPYYQNAPTGWKNSVRHNLSLNKCFKKVDKDRGQAIGKGSLWCIDPEYRPNLLQALRKTPYHPYHQLQMLASPQNTNTILPHIRPLPLSPRFNTNSSISPHLFPFLSKRLGLTQSIDLDNHDIALANALVSLKQNADLDDVDLDTARIRYKYRTESPFYQKKLSSSVVCTTSPSADHTYSVTISSPTHAPPSPGSSIDDEYDFGSDDDVDEDNIDDDVDECCDDSDYDDEFDEVDGGISHQKKHNLRPSSVSSVYSRRKNVNNNNNSPNRNSRKRKNQISSRLENNSSHKVRVSYKKRRCTSEAGDDEDDEDLKLAEGANALLNLAGFMTSILPLKSVSPPVGASVDKDTDDTDEGLDEGMANRSRS